MAIAKNDSERLDIYIAIGKYYQYSNPDSAFFYLQQGIKQFTTSDFKRGIATLTSKLGSLEANHGNVEVGRRMQKEALGIYEELGNRRGIGGVHNALGILDGMQGNNDSAASHFIIALRAYETISYTDGIVDVYINLGKINSELNYFDKALEYNNKALGLITDANEVKSRSNLYNNIAIIYGKKGNLKKALEYLEKALKLSDKDEYIDIYVYSLLNMGIVYSRFGDDTKALSQLSEALKIAKEKQMKGEYARVLINIAGITGKTDAPKAIAQVKDALLIAQEIGDKLMLEDAYSELIELSKQTGDYKSAVALMEEFKRYQDSTSGMEKTMAIANLQAVYELEQSNNKLTQLRLIDQAHNLKRNILITVVVCLAMFIVFILFYLDKTRSLNTVLSKKEEQLADANKVKDRLFSVIGHDLRSPIGNITMILDVLEDQSSNPDDQQMLHSLKEQASASLETLDKLLYWGKAQISGKKIEIADFGTDEHISKNVRLLKMGAEQKNIAIQNNVDRAIIIHGDPSHFDFIIRNLLSNAIKFTRTSGIIQINADTTGMPGYTVFSVKDNGVGMSADKLLHIFEPFVNNTVGTAKEKGTGIGLMLCKEFVLENNGEIWVESTEGEGTTFYFSFRSGR